MDERLVRYLEAFGLTEYEARVYLALVIRGVATASELSDISGVPYTRIYDVLNSLEKRGLVVKIPVRPMKFRAVHPSIAVKNLKEKLKADFERKLKELEEEEKCFLEEVTRLYEGISQRGKEDVQIIRGRISFHGLLSVMFSQFSGEDVYILASANTLKRLQEYHASDLESLKKRGVNVHLVELAPEKCAHSRCIPIKGVPACLITLGENLVLYDPIPDDLSMDSEYDVAMLIKSPKFVNLIKSLIERAIARS